LRGEDVQKKKRGGNDGQVDTERSLRMSEKDLGVTGQPAPPTPRIVLGERPRYVECEAGVTASLSDDGQTLYVRPEAAAQSVTPPQPPRFCVIGSPDGATAHHEVGTPVPQGWSVMGDVDDECVPRARTGKEAVEKAWEWLEKYMAHFGIRDVTHKAEVARALASYAEPAFASSRLSRTTLVETERQLAAWARVGHAVLDALESPQPLGAMGIEPEPFVKRINELKAAERTLTQIVSAQAATPSLTAPLCTRCHHPRDMHGIEQPYECEAGMRDPHPDDRCECEGFSYVPAQTVTAAASLTAEELAKILGDLGMPKGAPSLSWAKALLSLPGIKVVRE
jgi:hypothetical protein